MRFGYFFCCLFSEFFGLIFDLIFLGHEGTVAQMEFFQIKQFQKNLLAHYAAHGRDLPWRRDGITPYEVWISEIMLQQTTVATVVGYYERFLAAFPTIEDFAVAEEDEVFQLWQGLGYYSRARNLMKCAKVVVAEYGGVFPTTEKELLALPGIGPYTAAAIRSMAFDLPAAVVDGNVERVMARLFQVEEMLPAGKGTLKDYAERMADEKNPSSYSHAIMDLGATVCTPKKPLCLMCPVNEGCRSASPEVALQYPKKAPKKKKPERVGEVFVLRDSEGRFYLKKRPEKGLLGGLYAFPSVGWDKVDDEIPAHEVVEEAGVITHVFTHFKLTLTVRVGVLDERVDSARLFRATKLPPMPTLMRKVLGAIE